MNKSRPNNVTLTRTNDRGNFEIINFSSMYESNLYLEIEKLFEYYDIELVGKQPVIITDIVEKTREAIYVFMYGETLAETLSEEIKNK